MKYSLEQEKILHDESNFKQVIAAAGSGKTSTMIALLELFTYFTHSCDFWIIW